MLDKLRAGIAGLPPAARMGGAIVFLLVAGGWLYVQIRGDEVEWGGGESGSEYYRLCTHQDCGHVIEDGLDSLVKSGAVMGIEVVGGLSETGKKCPECGQPTLRFAVKCPKDGTVFAADPPAGSTEPGKCPKCGWTPSAR